MKLSDQLQIRNQNKIIRFIQGIAPYFLTKRLLKGLAATVLDILTLEIVESKTFKSTEYSKTSLLIQSSKVSNKNMWRKFIFKKICRSLACSVIKNNNPRNNFNILCFYGPLPA